MARPMKSSSPSGRQLSSHHTFGRQRDNIGEPAQRLLPSPERHESTSVRRPTQLRPSVRSGYGLPSQSPQRRSPQSSRASPPKSAHVNSSRTASRTSDQKSNNNANDSNFFKSESHLGRRISIGSRNSAEANAPASSLSPKQTPLHAGMIPGKAWMLAAVQNDVNNEVALSATVCSGSGAAAIVAAEDAMGEDQLATFINVSIIHFAL